MRGLLLLQLNRNCNETSRGCSWLRAKMQLLLRYRWLPGALTLACVGVFAIAVFISYMI